MRDKEFSRPNGLPSPKQLHEKTVELLKAAETYHFSLNAALKYPTENKISNLSVPLVIPNSLEKYAKNFSSHESFCVSPSTASREQVLKAADQIKIHLKL